MRKLRWIVRDLKELVRELPSLRESLEQDYGYTRCCEGRYPRVGRVPVPGRWLYVIVGFLTIPWTGLWCCIVGHKIRDCSSAGPDHGDMDHECVRCGRYWSVPLY